MPPQQGMDSKCIRRFGKDANKALVEEEPGAESLNSSSSLTTGKPPGAKRAEPTGSGAP